MINKLTILTFVTFYLPGYKAGGPLRTIANMVDHLSDDFNFLIVTMDRDLGDKFPYPGVQTKQWQPVGNAMVYYLPHKDCTIKEIANLIVKTQHDVLYLNSFFEPIFTLKPLLARRFGWIPNKPIIVAPRGEFSTGAIELKYLKKFLYIKFASLFRLYKNVTWQASSEYEAMDIVRVLNASRAFIHVASDLSSRECIDGIVDVPVHFRDDSEAVRIVFLSRISPMKNLDFALRVLSKVNASAIFDIYGPIEDAGYWLTCKKLMTQLPTNVSVNYLGSVHPAQVADIFSRYDLFFFPTRGENYGHVIAEALSVGTKVLLSDQTPWRQLETEQIGWDIPLQNLDRFVRIIDGLKVMTAEQINLGRRDIMQKLANRLSDPQIKNANLELFKFIV
jgi:glycosyltransferase involved in cell wall biosynthesis